MCSRYVISLEYIIFVSLFLALQHAGFQFHDQGSNHVRQSGSKLS